MRELKTQDVFKMSRILKKMDIKIDVNKKTQTQVGAEVILKIAENMHMAENEINEFMGSLIGIPAKEFTELPLAKTAKYFEEFKNLPSIANFFKLAGQLNK